MSRRAAQPSGAARLNRLQGCNPSEKCNADNSTNLTLISCLLIDTENARSLTVAGAVLKSIFIIFKCTS